MFSGDLKELKYTNLLFASLQFIFITKNNQEDDKAFHIIAMKLQKYIAVKTFRCNLKSWRLKNLRNSTL